MNPFVESLKDPLLAKEDGRMPNSTWDCHLDEFNLPMADHVISELCRTWKDVEDFISKHIHEYGFVKSCKFSPKDWKNPPIFESAKDALEALMHSNRCYQLPYHVVMKKVRKYKSQARVFYATRPTLVCGNMDSELVRKFMEKYKWDIPFNYCCLELGEITTSSDEGGDGASKVELI